MALRLALVVDKSDAFLSFQKERILNEWDVDNSGLKKISKLSEAGGVTLFGDNLTSLFRLETPEEVKALITDLEKVTDAEHAIGSGLLLLTAVDRRTTKKLETLVVKLGGAVHAVKDSKDKQTNSAKLLEELRLNREAREFLLTYVGEDYSTLIPLVSTISALTPEQQHAVTVEDLYIRLPQAPGSVAPWALEKPLFAGNYNETIDIFRRVSKHSHFLVVLAVLRNKIQLAYRVAALQELQGPLTSAALAERLGVADNYPLKLAMGYAKKYGLRKLQRVAEDMAQTEAKVKGGSGADPTVHMELMLIRTSETLRS